MPRNGKPATLPGQRTKSRGGCGRWLLYGAIGLVALLGYGTIASLLSPRSTPSRTAVVPTLAEVTLAPVDTPPSADTPTVEMAVAPTDLPTDAPVEVVVELPAAAVEYPTATPALAKTTANDVANVRAGPSTDSDVIAIAQPGQELVITGRNVSGEWLQLASGYWIVASLVANAPIDLPVVDVPVALVPTNTPEPVEPVVVDDTSRSIEVPVAVGSSVVIVGVDKQAEYVDVLNQGAEPVDLSGWRLLSVKGNQECILGGVIQPSETLRIWAMQGDSGYSCQFGSNIWNNSESDPAELYDAAGALVSNWQ